MDLEKYQTSLNAARKVIHDAQEIIDHKNINNHIFSFYKKRFEERLKNDCKTLLEML